VQTTCPQCSQGIIVDDAKIPDRPFSIRCPRCKSTVHLSGKGAPPAAEADREPAASAPPPPTAPPEEARTAAPAAAPREIPSGPAAPAGRALVFLSDRAQAAGVTPALTRQGFTVDVLEDGGEAARRLDQGAYTLLVTARVVAPQGAPPSLYQRLSRLNPDARRRVFVMLLGDEFKSGDGTQAFTALADLVVSSRDGATCDALLRATLQEKQRLYQAFLDARERFEET
jgi:predicted Zn finger-like uncharacterized protein